MQAQMLKQPSAPTNNVYSLVLKQKKSAQVARPLQARSRYLESKAGLLFVILAHASVIYWLLQQSTTPVIQANQAKPMMVSLIAPPAPTPELAPIIEQPKPIVEPKPKKMVEKIKPIETPTERLVEVSLESDKEQEITAMQVAPVVESRQAPAPQMAEPIMEESQRIVGQCYLEY